MVFEVSAFGGFRGAHEGMGIDVPSRYVAHVMEAFISVTQPADDHRQMESKTAAALLIQEQALCEAPLYLNLGELTVTIKSNSRQLLNRLADYFSHLPQQPADDTLEIVAIESDLLETGIQFTDWKREAGKTGRKDAYLELFGWSSDFEGSYRHVVFCRAGITVWLPDPV